MKKENLETREEEPQGLVISAGHDTYCVEPGKKILLSRNSEPRSFVFHEGELYHISNKSIYHTATNKQVAKRDGYFLLSSL